METNVEKFIGYGWLFKSVRKSQSTTCRDVKVNEFSCSGVVGPFRFQLWSIFWAKLWAIFSFSCTN